MAASSDAEIHVSFEDQQKINNFSRLNTRNYELTAEIQQLKTDLEKISDASDELYIADDLKYV